MGSNAKFGYGTLVKMGDGATPEVFTAIAELKGDISFSGMESDEIEITTHNNAVNGRAKEKIPGLIDPGSLDIEINYIATDATHVAVRNAWQTQTKKNFQILSPQGDLSTFSGYVMSLPVTYPVNDVINAKIKIMITGLPVFS
jgi:predicted secreted protein